MTKNAVTPLALFDTLSQLQQEMSACVRTYLQQLTIDETEVVYSHAREFLLSYAGSEDTFTSYRREVERFLQWAWLIAAKPLSQIDRNDIRTYIEFASEPPNDWITLQQTPRFVTNTLGERIQNPAWRPFFARISKALHKSGHTADKQHYRLGNKSLQAIFATLSSFFSYLQQEEYIPANPVQLVRQKSRFLQKQQSRKVTRKLSHTQWQFVIDTVENSANTDPEQERVYFLMSAFYLLGLRISELAETPGRIPVMSHFAPDKDGRWWFTTVGKGNKIRDIAVPDEMLTLLKRYRMSLNLSPLPTRGEQTPLLNKQRGVGGLGTRQVRYLVQACFNQAVEKLFAANKIDEAEDLKSATVHWLRHTAISSDIMQRPREHVRDDAGHGNAATTEQYIDVDRKARHDSARHKKLTPS